MLQHGTLKDTQGILRHASIRTTGDIYVQAIDASVQQAVNSRTSAVLNGWTAQSENMGIEGKELERSFSDSAKFGEVEKGAYCKCLILWLLR